ncbi:MAG: class I SAM-dependent methyltransferase [Pseudomonadota bacterium]
MINAQTKTPDFTAIKTKQKAAWGAGDYAAVGATLQIVAENLCEAMDLRAGSSLLDVAAGNGACALAAARRFCDVTASDYVPALLEKADARAKAEGLPINTVEADVEALPFDDASFDYVTSTFGVMFAPDQMTAAQEMLRVVKPGGKIGLTNWTPDSFIGRLFKVIGAHVAPPAGINPPALWGTNEHLDILFNASTKVTTERRTFNWRYRSPEHWVEEWKAVYGPVQKAFAACEDAGKASLEAGLYDLIDDMNLAGDGTMIVPSAYLEVIVIR